MPAIVVVERRSPFRPPAPPPKPLPSVGIASRPLVAGTLTLGALRRAEETETMQVRAEDAQRSRPVPQQKGSDEPVLEDTPSAVRPKAAKSPHGERTAPSGRWFDPEHPHGRFHVTAHAHWPRLFPRVLAKRRTMLAHNVGEHMIAMLEGMLDAATVRDGLRAWRGGNNYLRTLAAAAGQPRHGLDGHDGEVTPEEAETARATLARREARRTGRLAEENGHQVSWRWLDPAQPQHAFHAAAHARWPDLFPKVIGGQRVPLAIGIHQDILAALDGALDEATVNAGVASWVKDMGYLHVMALSVGQSRHGLAGPRGVVSADDARWARVLLGNRTARSGTPLA